MYRITISPSAKKDLKKINKDRYRRAVSEAIEDLKYDPFVGKPLGRELKRKFSYRIENYRIIYKINKADKIIEILKIRHRARVYN